LQVVSNQRGLLSQRSSFLYPVDVLELNRHYSDKQVEHNDHIDDRRDHEDYLKVLDSFVSESLQVEGTKGHKVLLQDGANEVVVEHPLVVLGIHVVQSSASFSKGSEGEQKHEQEVLDAAQDLKDSLDVESDLGENSQEVHEFEPHQENDHTL
jgi:hypothetical protein